MIFNQNFDQLEYSISVQQLHHNICALLFLCVLTSTISQDWGNQHFSSQAIQLAIVLAIVLILFVLKTHHGLTCLDGSPSNVSASTFNFLLNKIKQNHLYSSPVNKSDTTSSPCSVFNKFSHSTLPMIIFQIIANKCNI